MATEFNPGAYFYEKLSYSDIGLMEINKLNNMLDLAFRKQYISNIESNRGTYWERACPVPKRGVKFDKDGKLIRAILFGEGSYFKKRDSVEFCESGRIYFCPEASTTNEFPVTQTFIKWVNWVVSEKERESHGD